MRCRSGILGDGRYRGVIRGRKSRGSPSRKVGAQARPPSQGVLRRHTCTKLLSKMEKSRSWSNSPLRRWRWSRPGRPVGQAGTRARSRGSNFGGLFQQAGPGILPRPAGGARDRPTLRVGVYRMGLRISGPVPHLVQPLQAWFRLSPDIPPGPAPPAPTRAGFDSCPRFIATPRPLGGAEGGGGGRNRRAGPRSV